MANDMKRATHKDYTAWDLNYKCCVRNHHHQKWQKLEKIFKRKARRKMKEELRSADMREEHDD